MECKASKAHILDGGQGNLPSSRSSSGKLLDLLVWLQHIDDFLGADNEVLYPYD